MNCLHTAPRGQVQDGPLDLQDYDTLAYRVRGDGRRYITSLRTENWVVDNMSQDVWQAFLFARRAAAVPCGP